MSSRSTPPSSNVVGFNGGVNSSGGGGTREEVRVFVFFVSIFSVLSHQCFALNDFNSDTDDDKDTPMARRMHQQL